MSLFRISAWPVVTAVMKCKDWVYSQATIYIISCTAGFEWLFMGKIVKTAVTLITIFGLFIKLVQQ